MSSTTNTPNPRPAPAGATIKPETQRAVNNVAARINEAAVALSTQQASNDRDTAEENARRAQDTQKAAEARQQQINAAARAQRSINEAREQQLQVGDMVVIDLTKPAPEQLTQGLRQQMRFLHQAGAHHATGRVTNIETQPMGRMLHVDLASATYQVPEQFATRADMFDDD